MHHFFKTVGKLSTYDIAYKGLKEGLHEFKYKIGAQFFELFEGSLIEEADIEAKVLFEKRSSLLSLTFILEGVVELVCDRCLEKYVQPVSGQSKVFVKFGEGRNENSDEIFWVPPEEHQINIAQLLYEFSVLSLPVKHIHPDGQEGNSTCEPEMLERIEKLSHSDEEEKTDERWDALKKLRNNN